MLSDMSSVQQECKSSQNPLAIIFTCSCLEACQIALHNDKKHDASKC